ncbi:hypothetical protein GCM10022323_18560 [Asaccharospora irregularis DSM 2635]
MNIDYKIIIVVMLFVVLLSLQLTLNKIYIVLKEIRELIRLKRMGNDKYD